MLFSPFEIEETLRMFSEENLDVRTITMGINLLDCIDSDPRRAAGRVYDKITRSAARLTEVGNQIEAELGVPIINKRIAVTPISMVAGASLGPSSRAGSSITAGPAVAGGRAGDGPMLFAETLERAAQEVGVDFLGGFSALVHRGLTPADERIIRAIPAALSSTEKVCASLNVATSRAGINMAAVQLAAGAIKEAADRTRDRGGFAASRLVTFANAPEDNPFMAGAFHGPGNPDTVVHVGVSGPGVVQAAVSQYPDASLDTLAEAIKKTAFKITRLGQLVLDMAADRLGVERGIVDLSLAPTPAVGDSVARILEEMGLEMAGAPGSTAALALLNNAVKKGGLMASSHVGGLSGSFLPVSEDEAMARAAEMGVLTLEKLEAMTAICSVGLDMIAVPGDTSVDTLSGIIADEMAIGVMNHKTTAVRIIPVPGKRAGEWVEFGGLLGRAPVMPVNRASCTGFVRRGGIIPAPVTGFRN
ncbi:MAG: PFL family protein [Alkalispirochaeta sp.]